MFFLLSGAATNFFQLYLKLLEEGKTFDAVRCWDLSAVFSKVPLGTIFLIAALFIFSLIFSWRGLFFIALLKRLMENGKLLIFFIVSVVVLGFVLRFFLAYTALRFMVVADSSILKSQKIRIVAEEDRGDTIAVRYVLGEEALYEAILKKHGDSCFKILKSKQFIGRYKVDANPSDI